jgi:hypothetical protein
MKRRRIAAGLALAALVVLGLAGPVAAGDQVPFKGRLDGVATVSPLTPPFVAIDVEGSGHATQLGHFEVSIPHVTNRSNGTAVGSYEFTAANGDTLTADFTSQVTPTDVPGVVSVAVTATITGGTGRFAGATGSFVGDRLADTVNGTITESFNGTISTSRRGKDSDDDHND